MLEKKGRIFYLDQKLICALMFFAGMNIFAKHVYCIFFAFAILILSQKEIKFDKSCAVLFLFSFFYGLFYDLQSLDVMGAVRRFAFPMCYVIGYNFILRDDETLRNSKKIEYNIILPIIMFALGAFTYYFINFILNFGNTNRNGIDVWSGEIMSATGQAMLASLGVAIFIALLFSDYKLRIKLLSMMGLVIVFLYNLILAGRTLLFLALILTVVCFLYKMKHSDSEHKVSIFFVVLFVVLILYLAYMENWFGIQDMVHNSNLWNRFDELELTEDSRNERKQLYLKNLFSFPWGGNGLRDLVGGYAHDIFLDCYSDAGIITVFLLLAFIVVSISKTLEFVLTTQINYSVKLIVLSVNIATIICFFVEPIFQGMPWLFSAYCFTQGIIMKSLNFVKKV